MNTTLCWKGNHVYPIMDKKCPVCGATNANVDPDRAKIEETGFSVEEQRKAAQFASQTKPFNGQKKPNDSRDYVERSFGFPVPPADRPSRAAIIGCIAAHFGVNEDMALDWILAEFRGDIEFSARKEAA